MVCVSCIVVPLFLWIWHKFLQPIFLKLYNPWAKVEDQAAVAGDGGDQADSTAAAPPAASGCPFTKAAEPVTAGGSDKKTD